MLAAALFCGCDKDDVPGTGEDDVPGIGEEIVTLPKKLVKVERTVKDEEEGYTETSTTEYVYDESGRLSKIDMGDGEFLSISYTENEVALQRKYKGQDDDWQAVFHLKNGRAVKCVEEEPNYKCETEYSYGSNGYLNGFVCKETDPEGSDSYKGTLTFGEGGYLKTFDINGNYSHDFVPNKKVRNNLNLDLIGCDDLIVDIYEQAIEYAYLLGIGGKRSTYLPEKFTATGNDEGGKYSYTVKYDYTFNGDYLSEIRMNGNGLYLTLKLYYEE